MLSDKKILIFVTILLGVPFLILGYFVVDTLVENGIIPKKLSRTCYTEVEVTNLRENFVREHGKEASEFKQDKPTCLKGKGSPKDLLPGLGFF